MDAARAEGSHPAEKVEVRSDFVKLCSVAEPRSEERVSELIFRRAR
jgi:hypothetical protein